MLKIRIHNPETNQIIDRDMTEQELFNYNTASQEDDSLRIKIAQEKARKESAIAKLKALGLTEEEVKSIL
jgi:phosphopantetheinyl transferase (holo-ACP synthase)